jgi:hypothetical protein
MLVGLGLWGLLEVGQRNARAEDEVALGQTHQRLAKTSLTVHQPAEPSAHSTHRGELARAEH